MARKINDFFFDDDPPKKATSIDPYRPFEQAQDNTLVKPVNVKPVEGRITPKYAPTKQPIIGPDNRTPQEVEKSKMWADGVNKPSIGNAFTDAGTFLSSAGTATNEEYYQNRKVANNPNVSLASKISDHSGYVYDNMYKPAMTIGNAEFLAVGNGFLTPALRSAMIQGAKANTIIDIKQAVDVASKFLSGEKVDPAELGLMISSIAARTGNTDFSTFMAKLQNGQFTGKDMIDISQDIVGLTTNALERSPMNYTEGDEYDLSQEEIDRIVKNGGSIEYIK